MKQTNYKTLCADARSFAQLDDEKIHSLHAIARDVDFGLADVTIMFYQHLHSIPRVQPFLSNHMEGLQVSHQAWLQQLFVASFDVNYTRSIYELGEAHCQIQLPAKFMAAAMSIIQSHLIGLLRNIYAERPEILLQSLLSINAALGFSLYVMQAAYQSSALDNDPEHFLGITGMSSSL